MNTTFPQYTFVQKWHAFTYAIGITRISLIILIAGLLMLLTAQGKDIIIGLAEQGALASQPFFLVVFYWAFSIWYWSRVLLNIRFPEPPTAISTYNYWILNLPRYLGTGAYVAIALAIIITWTEAPSQIKGTLLLQFFSALVWGGFFLLFVTKRRKISLWLKGYIVDKDGKSALRLWLVQTLNAKIFEIRNEDGRTAQTLATSMNDFVLWFAFINIILHLILFFGSWFAPVTLGGFFGALILLLLWGGSWLPIGSYLTYLADKKGLPVLTGMLVAALVFSFWNDNHEIRATEQVLNPSTRPEIDVVLKDWALHHKEAVNPLPFVVVATAGGGIRAAYWTGTVLGELHDSVEDFDNHFFALSGVSGGSVGASIYRAMINDTNEIPDCKDLKTNARLASARSCTQAVLEEDFLGPAVAALLYPDLLQRFLPGPWMPDRATALEEGWEAAFKQVTKAQRFAEPITQIYREEGRQWPALFLNATWSENGRRLVASNIRLTRNVFPLAIDQLETLQRDLRLSTAAHNSARFPGVSPPGSWYVKGEKKGHLVDGGYFENYGAETAFTILRRAKHVLGDRIRPVVILISSDPSLPDPIAAPPSRKPIDFAYEIRGILSAFLKTRNARGVEAATRLKEWAKVQGYPFAHFRMCDLNVKNSDTGTAEPPLGWTLSDTARRVINAYLPPGGENAKCGNGDSFRIVVNTFKPPNV